MSENKNIIASLIEEYDIQANEAIWSTWRNPTGVISHNMSEDEMNNHFFI